jgi:hypothetical protein
MIRKSFYDNLHKNKITVLVYSEQEKKEIMKKENLASIGGNWQPDTNTINLYETDSGIIAHECWHVLESQMFIRRGYSINLEAHNEHIAYYLQFLVDKVTKIVESVKKRL